jgi:GTP cyclohydrolase II
MELDTAQRELSELSQIIRQNCLVLRPHHGASWQQRETAKDILKDLKIVEAANMFQVPEQDIVELQHFREDHVRIRFREPSAAQAAYEREYESRQGHLRGV